MEYVLRTEWEWLRFDEWEFWRCQKNDFPISRLEAPMFRSELVPYATMFLRVSLGILFLIHGMNKLQWKSWWRKRTFAVHCCDNMFHPVRILQVDTKSQITGRLIAAARALAEISRTDLAAASGVPVETLARMESSGSACLQSESDVEAVSQALKNFGVLFVPEGDGIGAGVRLRFMRQDVRQIGRLENEGGIARDDDVPWSMFAGLDQIRAGGISADRAERPETIMRWLA
jgi:transcriptional regulator with XRE-family HTH domain